MQLTILMIPLITSVLANTPSYGQYGANEIPPLYPVESTAPLPANLPPSILAPPKIALSPNNSTEIPTSIVTDSRQYTPVPQPAPHYPIGNQTTVACSTGTGSPPPPMRTGSAPSSGYGKYGPPTTTGGSYSPTGPTKSSVPGLHPSSAASAGYSITWSLCVGAAVAVGGVLTML